MDKLEAYLKLELYTFEIEPAITDFAFGYLAALKHIERYFFPNKERPAHDFIPSDTEG